MRRAWTWPGSVVMAVSALLTPASGARADEPPLTLEEAHRAALADHPSAAIARARLDKAEAARGAAWAALFPSLTLSGTYTRRLGGDSTFSGRTTQVADALRGDLVLDLVVFDARALALLSASGQGLEAQRLESEELRRALSFEVSLAYYSVLSADSLGAAAIRRREAAETTAREAASRFEAGLATKNDVTRTELELAVARQEESTSRAALARARLALGALVGPEKLGTRPLADPPPTPSAIVTDDASALAARGDVRAVEARAGQLETLAGEPLLRLVPTLALRGLLFATNEAGVSNRNFDGNLSATLTWRLFDGGLRYAEHELRRSEVEEARARAEDTKARAREEVAAARISVEDARATLELAEVRARVAAQNAEEVRALFAAGLAGALAQVDAAVAEYEARASLVRQRVAVRVAELGLLAALGSWPGERLE